MAHLYRTSGKIDEVSPKNGNTFELDELYWLLDCELIEVVTLGRQIMIIDEEGKYSSKAVNKEATRIAIGNYAIRCDDFIVGDAIVCESNELD